MWVTTQVPVSVKVPFLGDAAHSTSDGDGVARAQVGHTAAFLVHAVDHRGEQKIVGGDVVSATIGMDTQVSPVAEMVNTTEHPVYLHQNTR